MKYSNSSIVYITMPKNIYSNKRSIELLLSYFHIIKSDYRREFHLDYSNTVFFAAELYAFYHYNIELLCKKYNKLIIAKNVCESVDYIMHLSNKYTTFVNNPNYYTAIHFKSFKKQLEEGDLDCFDNYIEKEFIPKSGLKEQAGKYIKRYLSELFINSRTHGKTFNIFCSGQIYQKSDKLKLILMDIGATIPHNIANHKINGKLNYFHDNDGEAIRWATASGNTTKIDTIGGLGLTDVKTFITENDGEIQIFSRNGWYSLKDEKDSISSLYFPIQGTLVILDLKISNLNNKKINKVKKEFKF